MTNLFTAASSSFEDGTTGSWTPGGTVPPTLTNSTVRASVGTRSLLVTWGTGGTLPLAQAPVINNLLVGASYTVTADVYVPTGSPDVAIAIAALVVGQTTSIKDQWVTLRLSFVAQATSHYLQIWAIGSPTSGQQLWIDNASFEIVAVSSGNYGSAIFGADGFGFGTELSTISGQQQQQDEASLVNDTTTATTLDYDEVSPGFETFEDTIGLTDSQIANNFAGQYIDPAGLTDSVTAEKIIAAYAWQAVFEDYIDLRDDTYISTAPLTRELFDNTGLDDHDELQQRGKGGYYTDDFVITDSITVEKTTGTNDIVRTIEDLVSISEPAIGFIDLEDTIEHTAGSTDETPTYQQTITITAKTASDTSQITATESGTRSTNIISADTTQISSTETSNKVATDATIFTTLNQHIVSAQLLVLGEWNLNRYYTGTAVNLDEPTDSVSLAKSMHYDKYFPISSIMKPWRWGNKICYPILNDAYSQTGVNILPPSSYGVMSQSTRDALPARCYIAGAETTYKYWVSSPYSVSASNGTISNIKPQITYTESFKANKILMRFNAHAYKPVSVSIEYRVDSTWISTGSAWSVPSSGLLEIYRATNGTWTATPTRWSETSDNTITINGIRAVVTQMTGAGAQVELVEFSPRFVADLTFCTLSYSASNDLSGDDFISPIGIASANTGSLKFSNDTGLFDNNNQNSVLYKRMDDGVLFTVDLIYPTDTIRELTMVSTDTWGVDGWDSATVSLADYANIMQKIKLPDILMQNYRASNLIWALCDMIGFSDTVVYEDMSLPADIVEYYWASKDKFVWEAIQDIALAYQIAVFFDKRGQLNIMTRDYLYNADRQVAWIFQGVDGTQLSDIMSGPSRTESQNINKVTVKYTATNDYSIDKSDETLNTKNEVFWEPPADWGVGAAQVVKPVDNGDTYITIADTATENIPHWNGRLRLGTNEFEYTGKGYYVNKTERQIKNKEDYLLAVEDNNGITPSFSGKIYLKNPAAFDYGNVFTRFKSDFALVSFVDPSTTASTAVSSFSHDQVNSCIKMSTPTAGWARRTAGFKDFGVQFDRVGAKFQLNSSSGSFGIFLWPAGTGGYKGYHFAIANGDDPAVPNTNIYLRAARVENDGSATQLVNRATARAPMINRDEWNYIEVIVAPITGGWSFNVYVNGLFTGTFNDVSAGKLARNTKAGIVIAGPTVASLQKVYAIDFPADAKRIPDGLKTYYPDDAWLEVKSEPLYWKGGQRSNSADSDKAFAMYLNAIYNGMVTQYTVLDYGGSYVGVVREIFTEEVRFENVPIRLFEILNTNPNTAVLSYEYTPLGASFTIINNSDRYQNLNGTWEDKVAGAERDDTFLVFGQSIFFSPEQTVENTDQTLIDRRGESSIEFNSEWIQTRSAAKKLADWVKQRFGKDSESYDLEVFGNPIVKVGDIVSVNYPAKGFDSSTFKAVVSRINNDWDAGLQTSLSLKRVVSV